MAQLSDDIKTQEDGDSHEWPTRIIKHTQEERSAKLSDVAECVTSEKSSLALGRQVRSPNFSCHQLQWIIHVPLIQVLAAAVANKDWVVIFLTLVR